ncbi:transcriptional regulator [Catellatospora methionotrophica]|uniref:Transcriptional regulator n=2 Tax=Catellatospora methionotrophica TaxID=121620 RepID=A0A8J3L3N6_9ACTN|nr:transcriptional regulator [Catellatospora methionotrophica]
MNRKSMLDVSSYKPEFNPDKLRLARERRGLTKEGLAELCGVSRRAVSDWESGRVEAPPVEKIGQVLDFPAAFFFGDSIDEVAESAVSFRALSSMSVRQANRVLAHASLMRTFSSWIDVRYATPAVDLPSIEELTASITNLEPSPVEAAESMRAMWGLGARPIKDLLALLESKGVRVFGLPGHDREVDAFSFWHEDLPLIFLNTTKSAERLRFDLAHELGHLCMHRDINTNRNRQFELDANSFASAFLMPTAGLLPQLVGRPTLENVMRLKKYWLVSATAMVRRLNQLGRLSDWQYRSWMVSLSEKGFRSNEPDGIQPEQSSLLKQILGLAREDGWSVDRIAKDLGFSRQDLTEALMGLTVLPVTSSTRGSSAGTIEPPPGKPTLYRVK